MTSTISIQVNGEDHEVLMSYGLLTELTRIVGAPQYVPAIAADHDTRDAIVEALLAKRSKTGKITKEVKFNDVEVAFEDVERLIEWAQDRLMDFFVKSARKANALVALTADLTSSSTGTEA